MPRALSRRALGNSVELPTGYVVRHPGDARLRARSPRSWSPATSRTSASPTSPRTTSSTTGARPRFDLDHDAWVLSGPTGRIVGYAFVWEAQPGAEVEGDAFVLPEYSGRGLGTLLLELMENRTRELAAGRAVTLGLYASHVNTGKQELLERRGFRVACTRCCGSRSTSRTDRPSRSSRRRGSRCASTARTTPTRCARR